MYKIDLSYSPNELGTMDMDLHERLFSKVRHSFEEAWAFHEWGGWSLYRRLHFGTDSDQQLE